MIQTNPIAPNSTNTVRQLWRESNHSTSGAVRDDPAARPRNDALIARPCSRLGNQLDTVRAMLGKAPASPAPNTNLTMSRLANPAVAPVSAGEAGAFPNI